MNFWNPGQFAGGFFAPPSMPVLDQLSASAYAGYSLRKVKNTFAGSAIRVRRSSDDAEQNIGFVGGELDTASLLSFVGANNGFVKTFYDQSGNSRDMAQATKANQPKIVSSGSLITMTNGKPGIQFTGGASTFFSSAFGIAQPLTLLFVAKRDADIGGNAEVLAGGDNFTCSVGTKATTGYFDGYSGADLISSTVVPQVTFSAGYVYNGASSAIYFNGASIASGDMGSNGLGSPAEIGSWAGGTEGGAYTASEFFYFASALSTADRQKVEASQAFFFNVGPVDFYDLWGSHWFNTVSTGATLTPFQVSGDLSPGFHAGTYYSDINYEVTATNSDPSRTLYVPDTWDDRDSGTTPQGTIHVPASFVLPDASPGDTPNNPTIILNTDTYAATFLNACARPSGTGNIWGYQSTPNMTHNGSGLIGGQVKQTELDAGLVAHAIGINVWGETYLSNDGTGYVSPATKADSNFDVVDDANYYGGNLTTLKMGTRLAIPSSVSAASLGVTTPAALTVYRALVDYGAYIVDNTAWDAVSLQTDANAATTLNALSTEILALFGAMRIVS